jgi:phage shock protein A
MGDETGRKLVGGWNWSSKISILEFIRPEGAFAKLSAAIAEESLKSMQENVSVLEKTFALQSETCEKVKLKCNQKIEELNQHQTGDRIAEDPQIQQCIEQLKQHIRRAETFRNAAETKLQQEKAKLERYKMDMQIIKNFVEVEQDIVEMTKIHRRLQTDTAEDQFAVSRGAFHERIERLQTPTEIDVDQELALNLED